MKRYLAAIAITVLLCSLAACGKATTPASGGSAAPAQSSQAASETNAPDEPVSSPSPVKAVVSVDYAPDELAAAYTDGNSDYQVKVVFTANTDIREFKYLELGLSDQEQSNDISLKAEKILFEMGTLTPGKPLVVSMLFDGALPNRAEYFFATFAATLIICLTALAVCLMYLVLVGWYLSLSDVLLLLLDVVLLVLFGTALSSLINVSLFTSGQGSAIGTIVSAGYGFLCGAYMPISNFGEGLQKVLSLLPGTYGTSLLRNHAMAGA